MAEHERTTSEGEHSITIRGAREHNLRNVDLTLPRDRLIVFTGISGSGKSSLAFDTIYAEGQRRYVESLSAYARQFLGLMEKPDVDSIEGLSPAISIDQKSASRNPRSTVGTITEVYDYLRLLYARIGVPHCPKCGRVITRQTPQQIVDRVLERERNVLEEIASQLVWPTQHDRVLAMQEEQSLVIDPGSRTFDWLLARGMRLSHKRSHSVDRGVADILNLIADDVSVEIGSTYTGLDSIDHALRTGKALTVYQKTYQLSRMRPMVESIARQAVAAMMRRIGPAYDVRNVILVGGGAFLFRKAVKQEGNLAGERLRVARPVAGGLLDADLAVGFEDGVAPMLKTKWLFASRGAQGHLTRQRLAQVH